MASAVSAVYLAIHSISQKWVHHSQFCKYSIISWQHKKLQIATMYSNVVTVQLVWHTVTQPIMSKPLATKVSTWPRKNVQIGLKVSIFYFATFIFQPSTSAAVLVTLVSISPNTTSVYSTMVSMCTQLLWSTMAMPVLSNTGLVKPLHGVGHCAAAQCQGLCNLSLTIMRLEAITPNLKHLRPIHTWNLVTITWREKMANLAQFGYYYIGVYSLSWTKVNTLMVVCWIILRGQQM